MKTYNRFKKAFGIPTELEYIAYLKIKCIL